MIEWRMTAEDVARIRFAYSPLTELILGLIVLRSPAEHALHLPWIRQVRPRLRDLDLAELLALVPIRGVTADFLSPTAETPPPDLAAELDEVRTAQPAQIMADIADVPGIPAATTGRIAADPQAAARRLAETMQTVWDRALADSWPRIRALLEADVLWRARRIADGGADALFADLHPTVTWHGDRLTAEDPYTHHGTLHGQGLLLVPSAMAWPRVRKMIAPYQPTLIYPARDIGTLWETGAPPAPDTLAALIGHSRARILTSLSEPDSTTGLAKRLKLTPGAVSQHLSILHGAGLITRTRVDRFVLYQRTAPYPLWWTRDERCS